MDEFDHRCSDKDCPYLGQSTRFASCKCKISREAMMLAAIDRLTRENEALRKALEKIADYSPASTVQPVAIAREALAAPKEPGQ